MSRIPTPSTVSRLPQLSRLQPVGFKRAQNSEDDSDVKRSKLNLSTDSSDSNTSEQSGLTVTNREGLLTRSKSLHNLASRCVGTRDNSRANKLSGLGPVRKPPNKYAGSVNSRVPPAAVSKKQISTAGQWRAGPCSNISNRMGSSRLVQGTVNTKNATQSGTGGVSLFKGKPKRQPWDMKGRLQDMEELMKENLDKREELVTQISASTQRIALLEKANHQLEGNVQEKELRTREAAQEISFLTRKIGENEEEFESVKRKLNRTIQDIEFSKSTLERQIRSLEDELQAKQSEISGLKITVSQMTSAQSGIQAQLTSTKLELEKSQTVVTEHEGKILHLNQTVASQKEEIAELNEKLREEEMIRRKLHNTIVELKGNIRVFCRVRPLIGEEIEANGGSEVEHINFTDERTLELIRLSGEASMNESTVAGGLKTKNGKYEFSYDRVFSVAASQAEIFEEISQLVQSSLDGYNVCVFAYGQTGSGKTYTMEGGPGEEEQGMIPRTVRQIFDTMKSLESKGWTYKLEACFLEIYNEQIRDLLSDGKDNMNYDIRMVDNKSNEIYVTNLKIEDVTSSTQIYKLLERAQQQRAVAATLCNERSSRSHSIFRLRLTGHNTVTTQSCQGTLNLVDLAGSERLKESGSVGDRLTETKNINRSLANLGNVIMALAQKHEHIPYRNSKLTHLLQNSLGGNSKTLMFVNLSPREECFNETLNSLRFAAKVNQCHIGTATKKIK